MSPNAAVAAIVAVVLSGCLGSRGASEGWTVERAEAITEVRGLSLRVADCRGLGRGARDGHGLRYTRFACSAGARAKGMTEAEYREMIAIVGMAAETNRLVTALGVPIDDAFLVDAPPGRTQEL